MKNRIYGAKFAAIFAVAVFTLVSSCATQNKAVQQTAISEIVITNNDQTGSIDIVLKNEARIGTIHEKIPAGVSKTFSVESGTWYMQVKNNVYVLHPDNERSVFSLNSLGQLLTEVNTDSYEYLSRAPERNAALDKGIQAAGNSIDAELGKSLKKNAAIAIFPITADNPEDSNRILEGISIHLVNSQKYTVVEKKELDALLAEHDFQMSGYVDTDTIAGIGQLLDADAVIFGTVNGEGTSKRLLLWAVDINSAKMLAYISAPL